jgi:hypothetical protein
LTGGSVGQLLSSEITLPGCRPIGPRGKATRCTAQISQRYTGPAESKNLCMRGYSMFENREISTAAVNKEVQTVRSGKVCGRNPGMYAVEKSDIVIVPEKVPNKMG